MERINQTAPRTTQWLCYATLGLGIFSFVSLLASFHLADGDLWGKLAIGAHVWRFGDIPRHDMFAFTPVLPRYIEHEWGAGAIFFGILKLLGPAGLMWLKLLTGLGTFATGLATARKLGVHWNALLPMAIPVAACLLPGYVPVVRSHAFTYCFFGLVLLGLESIRVGAKWPFFALPPVFLFWANVHGGFVAGLGTIGIYAAVAFFERRQFKWLLISGISCTGASMINIYGFEFLPYLIPALLNKRPEIAEWQPLPLLGNDAFIGFRILFGVVLVLVAVCWRRVEKKSWAGLIMLAITATLAWRSRRHAPFFAVATLAFAGPFAESALRSLGTRLRALHVSSQPAFLIALIYGLLATFAAARWLPDASFAVLAPVGDVPVREVDILQQARAKGNLAVPFDWGCYCSWRLYPEIKVSMDGRYETTYPEETFAMNQRFYNKTGTNWDSLVRDYEVNYVILEPGRWRLQPEDLVDHGYALVWRNANESALMVRQQNADAFRKVAAELPDETVDPLNASIPDKWWAAPGTIP